MHPWFTMGSRCKEIVKAMGAASFAESIHIVEERIQASTAAHAT